MTTRLRDLRVNLWKPANGQDWKQHAACKDADTDLFFPHERNGREPSLKAEKQTAAAKAYCARCAVTGECLAFGLSLPADSDGIYGGLTGEEREKLKRQRRSLREAARLNGLREARQA